LGIGLKGANSLLLKFSRSAETQADLLGVQMRRKPYNPIEMARFFQKLRRKAELVDPSSSPVIDPGNRMKASRTRSGSCPASIRCQVGAMPN
jgi:predicted Zn-dependent protease